MGPKKLSGRFLWLNLQAKLVGCQLNFTVELPSTADTHDISIVTRSTSPS